MLILILKDLLIQKKTLLFSFLYVVFFMFAFQKMGVTGFTVGIVAVTYQLINIACAYDDQAKAGIMLNSLPIKRSKIVLAKYLSVFVFFVIGIVVYLAVKFIIKLVGLPLNFVPITLEGVIGALFAVAVLNGIHFPFFFKLGYIKSKVINFITFFAVFFGSMVIGDFFRGRQKPVELNNLIEVIKNQSDFRLAVYLIGIILVMLLISYVLALRFYQNREF